MKLFNCTSCGNLVFFENSVCLSCQSKLGFLPEEQNLVALEPVGPKLWRVAGSENSDRHYRKCFNYEVHQVCNWMIRDGQDGDFCRACSLNRTIPDLNDQKKKFHWYRLETEKRRLIYSLLRLGLPVYSQIQDPTGLAFDFLADTPDTMNESGSVMTGHLNGLITINIAEADPVKREDMRRKMGERYRTILGHFRHESGHYYWDRLIRDSEFQNEFRTLFGDETQDYAQALAKHHAYGPPADWHRFFVSPYASCHPWEDWAETWSHYLHIIDTLETAHQFGLKIQNQWGESDTFTIAQDFDAYRQPDFQMLVRNWFPLTLAINSINRSMGHAHVYPFVLTSPVVDKLAFVHQIIGSAQLMIRQH